LAFGIPDEKWGERPVVWLQGPSPGDEAGIMEWLAPRLARFKQPKALVVVEALPLTGAGKLDRQAARRHFLQTQQGEGS